MAAAVATKEVVALPQDFRRGVVLPTTDDDDLIPLISWFRALYFLAGFDNTSRIL